MPEQPIYTVCQSAEKMPVKSHCPRCGYCPLTGATCTEMRTADEARKNLADIIDPPVVTPESGDISVCWECRSLLVYDLLNGEMVIRAMNRKEVQKLKADREKWELVEKLRGIKRRK